MFETRKKKKSNWDIYTC